MKAAPLLLLFLTGYASSNICTNSEVDGCINCDSESRKPYCRDCDPDNCDWKSKDCFVKNGSCTISLPPPIEVCGDTNDSDSTCTEECKRVNVVRCGNHCRPTCESCNWEGKQKDGLFYFEKTKGGGTNHCGGPGSQCEWVGIVDGGATQGKCVDKAPIHCKSNVFTKVSHCKNCGSQCDSEVCVLQNMKCIHALTPDTRTASIYLKGYKDEVKKDVKDGLWYFQKLTPLAVPASTFYSLQIPDIGYIGIQKKSDSIGWIILSAWDNRKDKYKGKVRSEIPDSIKAEIILKGTGMVGKEFDGEGTGVKIFQAIDNFPVLEKDYYLALQASDGGEDSAYITGYIYLNNAWKFVGKLKVRGVGNKWPMKGPQNFVENWSHIETMKSRKASYGPLYFVRQNKSKIQQAKFAQFEYSDNGDKSWSHQHVNSMKRNNEIIVETGGAAPATKNNVDYEFTVVGAPEMFTKLKQKIDGCSYLRTEIGIENCLRLPN